MWNKKKVNFSKVFNKENTFGLIDILNDNHNFEFIDDFNLSNSFFKDREHAEEIFTLLYTSLEI